MVTKTRKNKQSTAINFAYTLTKKGEVIDQSTIEIEISQEEVVSVAEIMKRNGGYPVEMCALEDICEKIYNVLYIDVLCEMFPNEEITEDYMFDLDKKMPDEMVALAEKVVAFKNVDQMVYLKVDGTNENKQMFRLQISNEAFYKMREIAMNASADKTDYENFKENAPEIYSEVSALAFECAYKYCMREYGEPKACVLREFPYQVYERI